MKKIKKVREAISATNEREKDWEDLSAFHLFHRLWTKAVGTSTYNKAQWMKLESILVRWYGLHKE